MVYALSTIDNEIIYKALLCYYDLIVAIIYTVRNAAVCLQVHAVFWYNCTVYCK